MRDLDPWRKLIVRAASRVAARGRALTAEHVHAEMCAEVQRPTGLPWGGERQQGISTADLAEIELASVRKLLVELHALGQLPTETHLREAR